MTIHYTYFLPRDLFNHQWVTAVSQPTVCVEDVVITLNYAEIHENCAHILLYECDKFSFNINELHAIRDD